MLLILGVTLAGAPSMLKTYPPVLSLTDFASIPGWSEDDHAAALAAFRHSCTILQDLSHGPIRNPRYGGGRPDWQTACQRAATTADPRRFFEENFLPLKVHDAERPAGLFTGYYEPEAEGSRIPSPGYPVPVYGKPADLIAFTPDQQAATGLTYGRVSNGDPQPYFSRRDIESAALNGRGLEILWLRDWADAFFIHVQGSGRVRLPDGRVARLAFAAKSGRPYTAIGGLLADRGIIPGSQLSMQTIRAWMAQNEAEARDIMRENQSYIFFREVEIPDPAEGPPGAQGVSLTARRSLAVDRFLWMYGTPMWIDTVVQTGPSKPGAHFRHLLIAQDTGTAIRGLVRGDIFWGSGEEAAFAAGHLKSPGAMIVLFPADLAMTLLAAQ